MKRCAKGSSSTYYARATLVGENQQPGVECAGLALGALCVHRVTLQHRCQPLHEAMIGDARCLICNRRRLMLLDMGKQQIKGSILLRWDASVDFEENDILETV